jgi:diguanylate cyclase (GGDEF)-like protein
MSIKQKFIILLSTVVVLFALISESVTSYFNFEKMKDKWAQQNLTNVNTVLELQKKSVSMAAMKLANDKEIIQGYLDDDPQKIIDVVMPYWEKVKEESLIYEIHFFKPPAISFVNFSNFNSIGADVKRVRKDIVWVTSAFKSSRHLMMCKTYAGVRATYPIIGPDGTMLGGVSLGRKVDWLPETIKKLTGKEAFLVYTEESAKNLAHKYYTAFLQGKRQAGDYIFAESTIDIPDNQLYKIDMSQKQQEIVIRSKSFILDRYELLDFNGDVMGYLAVLNSKEDFYDDLTARIVRNTLLVMIFGFLMYVFFNYQINGLLQGFVKIHNLTQRFKNSDFSGLKDYDLEAFREHKKKDEIDNLMLDVLEMGETLKRYYIHLEDEVSKKTLALFNANKAMEEQLLIDGLTRLGNRHKFFRETHMWETPQLALLNINGFKRLNALYGVPMGNEVLMQLADFISQKMAEEEVNFYRMGADEFTIISNGKYHPVDFEVMIVSLIDAVENTEFVIGSDKVVIPLDLSTGISFEKNHTIETANMALSHAKSKHKTCVVYSDALGIDKDYEQSIALTHKLRKALLEEGVVTYYQPIVDAAGNVLKYEALVRLKDGKQVLTPYHFLEFSKEAGYYKEISSRVVEQVFARFKDLDTAVSINLTAEDILDAEMMDIIKMHLKNFPSKERVVFEIVESESIQNLTVVENFILAVRQMGAKVAIDDFGSGYSNFSYLLKLAPDYLKIDGSLIRDINTDMNARIIVKTIIGFAKELHIKTIAEFVHSEAVFEVCKELGVDEFQGYYFSEPKEEI